MQTAMCSVAYYTAPLGIFRITTEADYLIGIDLLPSSVSSESAGAGEPSSLSDRTFRQILEYLDGSRRTFDLPYRLSGTPFQIKVWQALAAIPYGETKTYGALAKEIGHPGAARAVGAACHVNPLLLVVPCHRVIGGNGSLVGFAIGLDVKKKLLQLESNHATQCS